MARKNSESDINLIQAEHDLIFRITAEAARGQAAFKFRECEIHDENAHYIGRLDLDPTPKNRYEITIEGRTKSSNRSRNYAKTESRAR